MSLKTHMKKENGSMTIYVSIVLLSMLIILTAVFFISTAQRKQQLLTVMKIKETYEADNDRTADLYASLSEKIENKIYYKEDFNSGINYTLIGTEYSLNNGIIRLTSTNNDPQIYMYNVTSFNPNNYRYIEVRYRVVQGSGHMEFFMIEKPTDQTYAIRQNIITDGEWHTVTFDLWSNDAVKNRNPITGWRWDWISSSDAIMDVDYIQIYSE